MAHDTAGNATGDMTGRASGGAAGNPAGSTTGGDLTLTPPSLTLTPPAPVTAVPAERAATMLPLPEGRAEELAAKARDFAAELTGLDPRAPEFTRRVHDISSMGDSEIRAASQVANRMLKRPVAALASAKGRRPTPRAGWPGSWWRCAVRWWTSIRSRPPPGRASCSG
nr:hypothetical protein GCM10020093_010290 [Planobispora longispora]